MRVKIPALEQAHSYCILGLRVALCECGMCVTEAWTFYNDLNFLMSLINSLNICSAIKDLNSDFSVHSL